MKSLLPAGKRQYAKTDLLRLLEFVCGRNANDVLTQEDLENTDDFDNELAQDTARRGHRLQYVPLPPNYDTHGLYVWSSDTTTATHQFTNEEVELDDFKRGLETQPEKVTIYSNWSETFANLRKPGTSFKVHLSSLFKNHFPLPTTVSLLKKRVSAPTTLSVAERTPQRNAFRTASFETDLVPPPPA